MRLLLLLLLVPLLLVPAVAVRGDGEPGRSCRVHALLVGVSEYPLLARALSASEYEAKIRLFGPPNDVVLWREVLLRHLGAKAADVRTLVGWPDEESYRPTRANIFAAVDTWCRPEGGVGEGDRVYLVFCGHGARIPDTDGDEPDGRDEAFLPADTATWTRERVPGAITDDEFNALLGRLHKRGAEVVAVWDCCHAGSMLRAPGGLRARRIRGEDLAIPAPSRPADPRCEESHDHLPALRGVVGVYAARPHQRAVESRVPRGVPGAKPHGLLSYYLCTAIARTRGRARFLDLYASVLSAVVDDYGGTQPYFEGDLGLVAAPSDVTTADLRIERVGEGYRIDSGRLLGLEPGAVLAVYPLGAEADDPPRGKVVVEEASLVEARARPVRGGTTPLLGKEDRVGWARVVSLPLPSYRLPVAVVDEDERVRFGAEVPAPLRRVWEDPRVARLCPLVAEASDARWWVRPGAGSILRLVRGPTVVSVPREDLAAKLLCLFRHENLGRIAATLGTPADGPTAEARLQPFGSEAPEETPIRPGDEVRPGSRIEFSIANDTGEAWDVFAFVLATDFRIYRVWPDKGVSPHVSSRERRTKPAVFRVTPSAPGLEQLLVLAFPADRRRPDTHLDFLTSDPLALPVERSARQRSPLEALLSEIAFGEALRATNRERSAVDVAAVGDARITTLPWRLGVLDAAPRAASGAAPVPVAAPTATVALDLPPGIPDPRRPGGDRVWERSTGFPREVPARTDLLFTGAEAPKRVVLDLDAEGVVAWSGAGAELILVFEPTRRLAFYDIRHTGTFDWILVDRDADGVADEKYARSASGTWSRTADRVPWLSTVHFVWLLNDADRHRLALEKLAVLDARSRSPDPGAK